MTILTQEEAHRLFEYKDGELFWKEQLVSNFPTPSDHKRWTTRFLNKKAGSYAGIYVNISIKGSRHQAHRIIFLMHHGYLPKIVDHINGKTQDNRIENLRAATHTENLRNCKVPKTNTSGYKNVVWHSQRKKWNVKLTINHKNTSFGLYDDIELADLVAQEARSKYFGSFARNF